jgi:nucleotide-binding universal stress UspA family protein
VIVGREGPRLVFGDDGSAAADVGWLWINNHRWPGWTISVVTAVLPPVGPPVGPARSALHPWTPPSPRRLFTETAASAVEHLTAEADPRIVLDSCADAALLVIGPRGSGVLKHLHIGSTADWLLAAPRPRSSLLIVRSARMTRSILLCVDGSPHAHAAAQTLARLPWIPDTQITLVGIRERHNDPEPGIERAADVLHASGVRLLGRRLIDSIPLTVPFDVRSAILDTLTELKPDLVAVGTRGHGGFRDLMLGSTASAVVHHAPCSVLVDRAQTSTSPA